MKTRNRNSTPNGLVETAIRAGFDASISFDAIKAALENLEIHSGFSLD